MFVLDDHQEGLVCKNVKGPFMDKYLSYDENDPGTLYLDFLNGINASEFEEVNEYSIVLSKVILSHSEMEIWFDDPRILWFIPGNGRIHVVEKLPELPGETTFGLKLITTEGGAFLLKDRSKPEDIGSG